MSPTAPHLMTRRGLAKPAGPAGGIAFLDGLTLAPARVHELCGPSRRTLALTVARALKGPVIWIMPDWSVERLNPDGMHGMIDPSRLLFVAPRRAEDLLWAAEEALRSGAAPLVVTELPEPPGLTPVRRLHLAAETGAGSAPQPPLGLILTPEGAAPGIESRWSLAPHHPDSQGRAWRLIRLRARTAPEATWTVNAGRSGSPERCEGAEATNPEKRRARVEMDQDAPAVAR